MISPANKSRFTILICVFTVLSWVAISLISIMINNEIVINNLAAVYYSPHYNYFSAQVSENSNINFLFYMLIGCSLMSLYLIRLYLNMKSSLIVPVVITTVLCLSVSLQTLGHYNHFFLEIRQYSNKGSFERYHLLHQIFSSISHRTQEFLPGKRNAQFISDLKLAENKNIDLAVHRSLAYFLYPIDIRRVRNKPYDSLIVFKLYSPIKNIPPDYIELERIGKNYLVGEKVSDDNR